MTPTPIVGVRMGMWMSVGVNPGAGSPVVPVEIHPGAVFLFRGREPRHGARVQGQAR